MITDQQASHAFTQLGRGARLARIARELRVDRAELDAAIWNWRARVTHTQQYRGAA